MSEESLTKGTVEELRSTIRELIAIMQNNESLSKRDWFAGMALQGLVTIPDVSVPKHLTYRGLITKYAYELSDAMLVEREAGE